MSSKDTPPTGDQSSDNKPQNDGISATRTDHLFDTAWRLAGENGLDTFTPEAPSARITADIPPPRITQAETEALRARFDETPPETTEETERKLAQITRDELGEDDQTHTLVEKILDLLKKLRLLTLPRIKLPQISFPAISATRLAILASVLAMITTMEGSSTQSTIAQKSNKSVPAKTTTPSPKPQERITPDETIILSKEQFSQAKQVAKGLNIGFYPKAKIGDSYCTKAKIINDKEIIFILENGKTLLVTH